MDLSSPLLGGTPNLEADDELMGMDGSSKGSENALASRWLPPLPGWLTASRLERAASDGDISLVHSLLRSKIDPNAGRGKAVTSALCQDNWPIVSLLVEHGGRLLETESTVIFLLQRIVAQDDPGLDLVLRARAHVNARDHFGATPLLWAVARGSLQSVQLLLQHGAEVSTKDGKGVGAVAAAAFRGDQRMLREVLASRGNVGALDRMKQTPLFFACIEGHLDIVQCLLAAHSDVSHRSTWGGDALYCAVESNHCPIITALVQASAAVNGAYPGGDTALHVACARGHAKTVQLLLHLRADPKMRSAAGALPLDKARGGSLVQEVLRSATAEVKKSKGILNLDIVDLSGLLRAKLRVPPGEKVSTLLQELEVPRGAVGQLIHSDKILSMNDSLDSCGVEDGSVLTLVLEACSISQELCGEWQRYEHHFMMSEWSEKKETYIFHPNHAVEYELIDNYDGEDSMYVKVHGRGTWLLESDGALAVSCSVERTEMSSYFSVTKRDEHTMRATSVAAFTKDFKRISDSR